MIHIFTHQTPIGQRKTGYGGYYTQLTNPNTAQYFKLITGMRQTLVTNSLVLFTDGPVKFTMGTRPPGYRWEPCMVW